MYRLPLAEGSFDIAVMQMVLHYAEDPPGVLAEAARVLRPGGRLIVIDLAHHDRDDLVAKLAHRWPGFTDAAMRTLLSDAGLEQEQPIPIEGPPIACLRADPKSLPSGSDPRVRIWPATRAADAPIAQPRELAV